MDPASWTTHEVEDVCKFLIDTFDGKWPSSARIFENTIDGEHDITPKTVAGVARLQASKAKLWVVVYPENPIQVIAQVGLLIVAANLAWLFEDKKPSPENRRFRQVVGSPNNKLGDRQNSARVLGRIPDIYGMVRSTPDLIQLPYTTYREHRETETALMCVSKGPCTITDIREGDTLASQVDGLSYAVYSLGNIPTGNVGTDNADDELGEFIDDPVFTVRRVEAVNGQILSPDNEFTAMGDIPRANVGTAFFSFQAFPDMWAKAMFSATSATTGMIYVGPENTSKFRVGDSLRIVFPTTRVTTANGLRISPSHNTLMGIEKVGGRNRNIHWVWQDGAGPIPDLTNHVTGSVVVTAINRDMTDGTLHEPFYSDGQTPDTLVVDFSGASAPYQAQWAAIATYTAPISVLGYGSVIGNGGAMITPMERDWVGPFFMDDPLPNPAVVRHVVCNFVAQNGLYADDGKTAKAFSVEVEIEVTPADAAGLPTGPAVEVYPLNPELRTIQGSFSSRNTRALTVKFSIPEVQGRFLIRCRRLTRTPWKQDAPSQYAALITTDASVDPNFPSISQIAAASFSPALNTDLLGNTVSRYPNNGGTTNPSDTANSWFLPFKGNSEDQVRWTHCYALTTINATSLGNLTLIRTRSIANEGATRVPERRLNCLAQRRIQTWNGTTFGGSAVINNSAENILFSILKDTYIGNMQDAQIDFSGIAAAFAQVRAFFGGVESDGFGGEVAGQFNYTFDDDNTSLEDTINIICRACFCIPYREGDVIKVKPDIATLNSVLLVNHRNRVPGSESRTITFGTEEDYDGVRIDYSDVSIDRPNEDEIKTYTIPPFNTALRTKQLVIPGIRTKKHAAWHAWREYNKLFHQNTAVEMQVLEEAALLTLHDRVLVADGTRPDTEDGEIVGVVGVNVTTSQDVTVGATPATMFLQHTDGTVEAIAVASNISPRSVSLASVPSVALVTDPALGVRTGYVVVKNSHNAPTAFRVEEKECTEKGIYRLKLTNYSNAYYWSDGLYLWMPFVIFNGLTTHADWGPYELTTTITGGSTVSDVTRGTVYQGTANTHHISITTSNVFAAESYTKSAWVLKTATGTPGSICGSVESGNETFFISATDVLTAGHNSTVHVSSVGFPIGVWAMATVTYQQNFNGSGQDRMRLYVNDTQVSEFIGSGSTMHRPLSNIRIFGAFSGVNGFIGKGDEFRYWMRELNPEEVRERYNKTKI